MTATLCLWLALQHAEVVILIDRMGDERYRARARAQQDLEQIITSEWGYLFLPHLEQAREHRDPEVARRAARTLDAYYAIAPTAYAQIPWLDMLPTAHPERQVVLDQYLRIGRQLFGYNHAVDWPDYRYATWLYTRDLLRGGHSRADVVRLLDDMVMGELMWRAKRRVQLISSSQP